MIAMVIGLFLFWNVLGCVILAAIANYTSLGKCHGFPCLNPIWLYRHYKVNWFGAAVSALGLNLCCPIISICYWFYKLCTVGRR